MAAGASRGGVCQERLYKKVVALCTCVSSQPGPGVPALEDVLPGEDR